jgi:hypothetical protein
MSSALTYPAATGLSNNKVMISLLAGLPAPKEMMVDVARLERDYLDRRPESPRKPYGMTS